MNTRSHSLLRLLLLLLSLGDSSSLVANQSCSANITVSGVQESVNIGDGQPGKHNRLKMYLYTYVHPEQGFEGVSLVALVGTSTSTAWFSFKNTCFVDITPTAWWGMLATVEVVKKDGVQYISFQLRTEACSDACLTKQEGTDELSLHVEAHGPSRWRHEEPDQGKCQVRDKLQPSTLSYLSCKPPSQKTIPPPQKISSSPQKTTAPSPTQPIHPAAWVAISIIVVVALVTLGLRYRYGSDCVNILSAKKTACWKRTDSPPGEEYCTNGHSSPSYASLSTKTRVDNCQPEDCRVCLSH